MIQIISKTKKYVTLRMPIQLAYDRDMLEKEREDIDMVESKMGEVKATLYDKKVIKQAKAEFKRGDFISLSDLRKKYAW